VAGGELGFHHDTVRTARLLQQKKHRQERRCFLIEGVQLLGDALDARKGVERVFALRDELSDELLARLNQAQVPIHIVDRRTIDSLAQTQAPQGIVAVAGFLHHDIAELPALVSASSPTTVLVLPNLSDPGNAGTLIRAAEAFGAALVCFGPHTVEPYNAKVVRASMGSIFRVPIVGFTSWEMLATQARAAHLAIVGSGTDGVDVRSVTLPARVALVVGQERRGLAQIPVGDFERILAIPQTTAVESLNASVAGAILLYELARAHGLLGPAHSRTNDT